MLLALMLPSVIVWLTAPEPLTDETNLRFMIASMIGGIIAFVKEIADYKPKEKK